MIISHEMHAGSAIATVFQRDNTYGDWFLFGIISIS